MVTPVRAAIWEFLAADDTLTGLLATPVAIYHSVAPQDARYPFVVFHRQPGQPLWAFAGPPATDEKWVIKGVCRGPKAEPAEVIDGRLQAILHDAPLDIDGQDTLYFRRHQDVDYAEQDGAETVHHVGAVYRLVRE